MHGDDPFAGTWKLNVAKSKLPWPAPQNQITHMEISAGSIGIREEIVAGNGDPSVVMISARFDGQDYPVNGSPLIDTIAYERVDDRTIKGTLKQRGQAILWETVVVSGDGASFTGNYRIAGPGGVEITGFAVHERQ